MFAITVRMRRTRGVVVDSTHEVRRAITAAAAPSDGLEHVYAQTTGPHPGIVLFMLAENPAAAETAATALVQRAAREGLAGWRPVTCRAEPLAPTTAAARHSD